MTFEEKTISSEMIYKGAILNVRRDKVEVHNGDFGYREIIEHNGGAVAVALTDDGKVVLVKQFRKAMEKDMIELPAGKIEENEDPLSTINRELKEETGYEAKDVKLIAEFNPSVGYASETLYIYLATGLVPGEQNFDEHEAIDVLEVPLDEAIDMVVRGEITDGKSMVGLLLTKYHL
ncbi:MAG: NUDIX hydrolase [Eubacterium sp.]|nr:NUDIX hydrolase [Eubacterium sp.]